MQAIICACPGGFTVVPALGVGKPVRRKDADKGKMMKLFFGGFRNSLGLAALAFGGLFSPQSNAGIVYSTNGAPSPSGPTGTIAPSGLTNNYSIGVFNAAGTTFNFNARGYGEAGIRFNTGGASNMRLNAIGINAFMDDDGGTNALGGVTTGTITWGLYAGTSTTAQATFTQTITNILHPAGTNAAGPNVYLGNGTSVINNVGGTNYTSTSTWALTSAFASNNLLSGTTYTMVMTGMTATGSNAGSDELHWNLATSGNAAGSFGVSAVGYIPVGTGGSGTFSTTGMDATRVFAFDIDATAVPEPSTLVLYSVAAGGFFLFSFLRWRRAKTTVATVAARV